MTTYHVKTDGDDTKNGLSLDNAWKTIDHAQNNILAGDVVWISAGSYPETTGFVFDPPVSTKWYGASDIYPNLTKIWSGSWYSSTSIISNNGVEIYNCQIGNNRTMSPRIDPNNTGFKMKDCWFAGRLAGTPTDMVWDNIQCVPGQLIFVDTTSTNGTFTNIVLPSGTVGAFGVWGNGNTFTSFHADNSIVPAIQGINNSITDIRKGLQLYGDSGNVVNNATLDGWGIYVTAGGDGSQIISDVKALTKATVNAGNTLTVEWSDDDFYESSNNLYTKIVASGQTSLVVAGGSSNITFTERHLDISTDADISVLIDTWETTGLMNKIIKVDAVGARNIVFEMGDMVPNATYGLTVGIVEESTAVADEYGDITFPTYSDTFAAEQTIIIEKVMQTKTGRKVN